MINIRTLKKMKDCGSDAILTLKGGNQFKYKSGYFAPIEVYTEHDERIALERVKELNKEYITICVFYHSGKYEIYAMIRKPSVKEAREIANIGFYMDSKLCLTLF